MIATCDTAVIGAGPYGLSVGAHLNARGAEFRAFGRPLDTWRTAMPEGMKLKSDGFASNLSAPQPGSTLADYCAEHELPYHPTDLSVPLETFIDYGMAFQRRHVPDLEQNDVRSVVRDGRRFRVALDTGEELSAGRVVVATGITHFSWMPQEFRTLPSELVSHASNYRDLSGFTGKRVTVIGAGASAVVVAVTLARIGALTSLVARSPEVRFSSPPDGHRSLTERLRKPGSGLGPGWRSRASCDAPDLFRFIPSRWRPEIVRRHLGPSSAWHLRSPFESTVDVYSGRAIQRVEPVTDGVRLTLVCDPGDPGDRSIGLESDHIICATGYRADVQRLGFLDPGIRSDLKTMGASPLLSSRFESSVSDLYFLGLPAAVSFGPLMRFMYGDTFASNRITRSLSRSTQ